MPHRDHITRTVPFVVAVVFAIACSPKEDPVTIQKPISANVSSFCADSVLTITAADSMRVSTGSNFTIEFTVSNTSANGCWAPAATAFAVPKGSHLAVRSPFESPSSPFFVGAGGHASVTGYYASGDITSSTARAGMNVGTSGLVSTSVRIIIFQIF